MSPIRILASVLSLVSGLWAVYINFSGGAAGQAVNVGNAAPTVWLAVVGGIIVVDSLVSFLGLRLSFALGAALSALVVALVAVQWGDYVAVDAEAAAIVSAAALVADAVAFRPAKGLSEKDSPLNLPVFG